MKGGSRRIVVRLLRTWEARNFKRNHELMSIDFLLLDEKDCLIQGSIHRQRVEQFNKLLIEGRIFLITDFDVVRSINRYRMTDHQFMIRFTDRTTIIEVDEENYSIHAQKFRIRCYSDLLELANRNEDLPDVIGFLCSVQRPEVDSERTSRKVVLHILLEEGVKVRVTIWDDLINVFLASLDEIKNKSIVIIVTSINPKMFAGGLFLNTTTSTKFYLNAGFDIVRDFHERMNSKGEVGDIYQSFIGSMSDKQCYSISEIFEFLSNEVEQEKEFACTAKIIDVLLKNGWSYISCSKCSKKLEKTQSTLICNNCDNPQAVGVLRFRIEVVVDDGKDTTTFVIFDRDARKITNKSASDIMTVDETAANKVVQEEIAPACIRAIVGRTFKFQVKVTPYNFRSRYQTFTVSRILDANCNTETKESKQKNALGAKEESAGSCSTTIQKVKSEVTSVDTNTGNLETNSNKRRRLNQRKVILED